MFEASADGYSGGLRLLRLGADISRVDQDIEGTAAVNIHMGDIQKRPLSDQRRYKLCHCDRRVGLSLPDSLALAQICLLLPLRRDESN